MNTNLPGKISIGAEGVGEISEAEVDRRATELARMDGRTHRTDHDVAAARAELSAPSTPRDEDAVEMVETWDDSPASHGHQVPRVKPDDEVAAAEELTNQGLDEADRDQRVNAARSVEE